MIIWVWKSMQRPKMNNNKDCRVGQLTTPKGNILHTYYTDIFQNTSKGASDLGVSQSVFSVVYRCEKKYYQDGQIGLISGVL